MTPRDIEELLARLDSEPCPVPASRALSLAFRRGGGGQCFDCATADGSRYVVKCRNNRWDAVNGPALKILPTELICGRLGQLFHPPVCPPVAVVEVPEELTRNVFYPGTRVRPASGPSFGSRRVEGAAEVKDGSLLHDVPAQALARVATFQTWLQGTDLAVLVTGECILSIDHAFYLTGSPRWDLRALTAPDRLGPALLPGLRPDVAFQTALDELAAVPEAAIAACFARIPPVWGVPLWLRVRLAAHVLDRRSRLAAVLRLG